MSLLFSLPRFLATEIVKNIRLVKSQNKKTIKRIVFFISVVKEDNGKWNLQTTIEHKKSIVMEIEQTARWQLDPVNVWFQELRFFPITPS